MYYASTEIPLHRGAPTVQLSMPKLELQMPNPDKPEITNYKHHLILKLGQINYKSQYSNLK